MALFPVANPVGAGFLVNGFLSGLDQKTRMSIIRRIVTDYLLVGLGSLAVGHFVLALFDLSLPIIQLGGGLLICRTALQWLGDSDASAGRVSKRNADPISLRAVESRIFYPITFPISIGPGSVSVILTMMASASIRGDWVRSLLFYAIIRRHRIDVLDASTCFLHRDKRSSEKSATTAASSSTKMVAFFTFCVGVQIVVTGIAKIFHLTAL